uniref:Transmembrane protein C9orf91-like n=1 Tax=Sinocyclocheilus anshuiensis TaxID=1608454 RepID=A0A671P3L9_9TELE
SHGRRTRHSVHMEEWYILPRFCLHFSINNKPANRNHQTLSGQCVASVSTSTWITPTFDFSHCRTLLETKGFQIPAEDFEGPLRLALDHPSVRRYLLFNSNIFNVIMASINMNTDVRLVGVNEHTVRHKLLLGVADWVQKCRGNLQLFCVYWDLSPCLISLTEALNDTSFVRDQVQNKLKKRMSHLVLVTEVTTLDPETGVQDEELPEEEQPLLVEGRERSASTSQREDSKLTKNFSLMPDTTLSNQVIAQQLLMTYSALYVRLLVSNKLPAPPQRPTGAGKNHSTSCLCLCEYVELKVLR